MFWQRTFYKHKNCCVCKPARIAQNWSRNHCNKQGTQLSQPTMFARKLILKRKTQKDKTKVKSQLKRKTQKDEPEIKLDSMGNRSNGAVITDGNPVNDRGLNQSLVLCEHSAYLWARGGGLTRSPLVAFYDPLSFIYSPPWHERRWSWASL